MMQFLIAIDQVVNTLVRSGYADETLSARAYRMTEVSKGWNLAHKWIDILFKVAFRQDNHCYESYLSEIQRMQLPKEYRASRLHSGFFTSNTDTKPDKTVNAQRTYLRHIQGWNGRR